METMRRSRAGRRLWTEHLRSLRVFFVFGGMLLLLMPIALFAFIPEDGQMTWASTVILFAGLCVALVSLLLWEKKWEAKNVYRERGARGEIAVGRELERLHVEGFHIFHDYKPENSGNVDHFLVGEGGVFIVETKNWAGEISTDGREILVNGRPSDNNPVVQASSEACRIRELIKTSCGIDIWVQPVLCFVGDGLRVYAKVRDVEVTGVGAVNRSVMQASAKNPDYRRLSASQVRAVSRRLEKHIGERPAASPGNPPDEPPRLDRLLKKPELLIALYLLYFFVASLFFSEKVASLLEGVADLYRIVGLIWQVSGTWITAL